MNKVFIIILNYLIALLVVLGAGCSLGPTTGTETGNPDITACLNAASELFDTAGLWIPSTYLPEGEQQLNPERIVDQWRNQNIAKHKVLSSADPVLPDSTYAIIVRIDTIIVIDTQLLDDTIVVDTMIVDTIEWKATFAADTSLLVARYVRHDSIIVKDTIIRTDTTYFQHNDTIWSPSRNSTADNQKSITVPSIPSSSMDKYVVVRDSATGKIFEVQTVSLNTTGGTSYEKVLSPEIRTGLSYLMVSQRTTVNGQTITESYHYAIPESDYGVSAGTAAVYAMSRGAVTYADAASEVSLEIDFDAGNDLVFRTTGDNRIHTLQRRIVHGSVLVDHVRYGGAYLGTRQDTLFLQRDRFALNDSVEVQVTNYRCIVGADVNDHRQNRLAGVYREIRMKNRTVKKIVMTVTPDHPIDNNETAFTGALTCTVDYGKGLTGKIDAVADYLKKTISGIYAQAGVEYEFTYSMTDGKIEISPLK